jgi:hypothetical protein
MLNKEIWVDNQIINSSLVPLTNIFFVNLIELVSKL